MPSIVELREERGKLETRMREMLDRAESENRDLNDQENGQFEELHKKSGEFRTRIDRQEKLDSLAKENQELRCGDHRRDEFPAGSAVGRDPDGQRQQPAGDRGERRTDADLALEGWALRSLGGRVQTHHHEAAKRLGSDLYQPHHDVLLFSNREFRSLQRRKWEFRDLDTAGEAAIIPTDFVAQLERAMLAFGGIMVVASQFRTTGGNPVVVPTVDDTANEADDVDEAADVAGSAADPVFDKVTFGANKASTMVKYSTELEEDAGFDLTGELSALLGERIARKMNNRCTLGNGTTQAQGIVTASALGHTADADDALEADDILTLIHSVDPAYRSAPGVGFLMHDKILLEVRKLKETDSGRYIWQPSMQLGVPDRLHGYPVNLSQDMADELAADAKPMLFGDLRKHRIRLVRGVRLVVARELYAETDEVAIIAHLRYDSKLMQPNAVKHLKMAAGGS